MTVDSDLLTAYALGILSPEDEARVRAEVEANPALRAQLDADLEALAALAESLPTPDLPSGAEDRLMARLHQETPSQAPRSVVPAVDPSSGPAAPPRLSLWPLWTAAGLAAAITAFLMLQPVDPVQQYARTPGAITEAVAAQGQELGQLVRLSDGRAFLYLHRAPEQGRVYQLWQIVDGQPASLGVFNGQGIVIGQATPGQTIAVSVEPQGGSPQPTTTPLLVQTL